LKKAAIITLIVLVSLPLALSFVIQIPSVQTFIVRDVVENIQHQFPNSSIAVDAVHFSFFNKLVVTGIYVGDANNDTLLYAGHASLSFSGYELLKGNLMLKTVNLYNGVCNIVSFQGGGTNLRHVWETAESPDTTAKESKPSVAEKMIKVSNIALFNFRMTYQNLRNPLVVPPDVINFSDLSLSSIFIDLRNLVIQRDTFSFRIAGLRFHEKSGYDVNKFTSGTVNITATQVLMQNVTIDDNHSLIKMKTYAMDYSHYRDFNKFVAKVKMTADFRDSKLSFLTIKHYARNFDSDNLVTYLNGVVSGTVNDLQSERLNITLPERPTCIVGSFQLTGLPNVNKTNLCMNFDDISTTSEDLAYILRQLIKDKYQPKTDKMVQTLGNICFVGTFDGFHKAFNIDGNVNTSLGEVKLNMLFRPTEEKSVIAEGKANTEGFHLGKLLQKNVIGELGAYASVKMVFNPPSDEDFIFKMRGYASKFDFNRYRYSDVIVDGTLSNRDFRGRVGCNDPHLLMNFDGYVAFDDGGDSTFALQHKYTVDIQHANLFTLHFNQHDTISELKANITVNTSYINAFDLGNGRIAIDNIFYRDKSEVYHVGSLSLLISRDDDVFRLKLRSDFADADFHGNHSFSQFLHDIVSIGYEKYLPCLSTAHDHTNRASDYEFTFKVKKNNGISYALYPDLYVADNTQLSIRLTPDDRLTAALSSPMLAVGNDWVQNVDINAENFIETNADKMQVSIHVDASEFFKIPVHNISGTIDYAENIVNTTLAFDNNNGKRTSNGALHFTTLFSKSEQRTNPLVSIQIQPSAMVLGDTLWNIIPASLTIDNEVITFNRLRIANQHQQIAVNGVISQAPTDTFAIRFRNFDVSNFNTLASQKGYMFDGILSGEAKLTDMYNTLKIFAAFKGRRLTANGNPLGDLTLQSDWDNGKKLFRLFAEINEKGKKTFVVNGTYNPKDDRLNIDSKLDRVKAVLVEPLLGNVLTNINGYLSGNFRLTGLSKKPRLYGSNVMLDSIGLTVDYLQTHYTLSLPVEITPTTISIHDAEVRDNNGGRGVLNGTLQHQYFRDIKYDLQVKVERMLCLNTTSKHNELFYGKAYATGGVQIKGDEAHTAITVTATTNDNSVVYIPVQNSYQAKESSGLTFVEPEKDDVHKWHARVSLKKNIQRITCDVSLTATPDAEVQIIFDQKAGDIIRAHGNGNIMFNINEREDLFKCYGDYTIDHGEYFFTLQNIISKKFILEQGSRIAFNGNLDKTTLDINGLYKTKVSLSTLMSNTTISSTVAQARRNVDCKINISGNLFTPALDYSIDVQNLDPGTRAQVQTAFNTEEKKTRQFLALLAFNSFMPDQQSGISNVSLTSGASELLSNQLSNIFTQLNIPFDMGVTYNTTEQGNSAFDVAVSTQLFNNRIAINGTYGNGTNDMEETYTNNFDLDIEMKFDRQGRFRGKTFTYSADQFTDEFDNAQRSGVGFIYQEDFNNFSELLTRWFGRKKKQPAAADTTTNGK
jgi:hypothetical protein